MITMSSVVQQGLILRDRIFTVSVLLPDKPGELCKVSGIVAKANGNVIRLAHNQFVTINRNAAVELRITMEAFGTQHKNEILKADRFRNSPAVIRPEENIMLFEHSAEEFSLASFQNPGACYREY